MKRISMIIVSLFVASSFAFALPAGWDFLDLKKKKDDMSGILPYLNPLKVKGDINIAGSSTVYPLSERIADRFKKEGFSGTLPIANIGSGAGLERYTKGEIDIANASRPINQKEIDAAAKMGMTTVGFKVGTDALAIVVNKKNMFIKNATKAELAKIFTATTWDEVNASYPKEKILRFIPGTDSGTFDYFVEAIFAKKKEAILNAPNTQKSEDDAILVQGVEGSLYAVGFFGYAYYQEEKARLNILNIEGVTASAETVEKNTYPLARPLFIYTATEIMMKKPQVAGFINYFLTFVGQEVKKVGYFPLSEAEMKAQKKMWVDTLKDVLK